MPAEFDFSALTALVVDASAFHRKIANRFLHAAGVRSILGAASAEEGLALVREQRPDVILLEWMEGPLGGLEFVRCVRKGEDIPNRAAPILMLSDRRRRADVEAARAAGANAYLMKPVSAAAIAIKIAGVIGKPRPFIATPTYTGPCRRRRRDPNYSGPGRRLTDIRPEALVGEDQEQVKAALRRARVAALTREALALQPDDPDGARAVYAASLELRAAADEIDDASLGFGARQLIRYLESVGATGRLDPDAVRTHVQALFQLARLPAALTQERRDLATSLRAMVDKKLSQAGAP
jgi:CheY-like chemotaxis protein